MSEGTSKRRAHFMPLNTRENPDTGELEILIDDEWVSFEAYRIRKIDEAYENSIKFLRERLGEDFKTGGDDPVNPSKNQE